MDEPKPDDWTRIHLASGAHIDSRDSITEFRKRLADGFAHTNDLSGRMHLVNAAQVTRLTMMFRSDLPPTQSRDD